MSKEIIINADKNQTRIALIEDGELAELHIESTDNERTLGDIYLGRVRRTMPSIQAAFIDIGQKQDAFLHYSDLADNLPEWLKLLEHDKPDVSLLASSLAPADDEDEDSENEKGSRQNRDAKSEKDDKVAAEDGRENKSRNSRGGSRGRSRQKSSRGGRGRRSSDSNGSGSGSRPPESYLDKGKRILVKIVKEPISQKGSRVSTDISLAGRFLVLVPLANYVAVSKKIYSYKERRRLRALARSLLPAGFGVIVRTVAEGKKAKELDTDLRLLLEKWRKIEKRLEGSPEPPVVVHEDVSMASSVIRDLFSDDYDRILIDDTKLFKNVKSYVQAVAPHMVPAVHFHKGKRHIFKAAKIAHDVNQAFQSRVDLPSGGYLFIEHTEAMHVVDVNSGRAGRGLSQEQNSLKVDLEAVHAITKQIRLRDLGGIIVIDFIDLREERNRKKVYFELKKAFSKDRAVTKILPMSDFGLVEITRQRLRPSITKTFSNVDPGKKEAQEKKPVVKKEKAPRSMTVEGFVEKIERWITSYKTKGKSRSVMLQVHPFAAAFLMQKIPAYTTRWLLKYFIRVKLVIDDSLDPLGMRFINPKTGEPFNTRSDRRRGRGRGGNRRKPAADKASTKSTEARSAEEATEKDKDSSAEDSKSRRSRGSRTRGGRGRGNRSRNSNASRSGKDDKDRQSSAKSADNKRTDSGSADSSSADSSSADSRSADSRKSDNRSGSKKETADRKGSGRQDRSESRRNSRSSRSNSSRSQRDDRPRNDSSKSEQQDNAVNQESRAASRDAQKDAGQQSSRRSQSSARNKREDKGASRDAGRERGKAGETEKAKAEGSGSADHQEENRSKGSRPTGGQGRSEAKQVEDKQPERRQTSANSDESKSVDESKSTAAKSTTAKSTASKSTTSKSTASSRSAGSQSSGSRSGASSGGASSGGASSGGASSGGTSSGKTSSGGASSSTRSAGSRSSKKTEDSRSKSSGNETQIRRHSTTYRTTLNDATSEGTTRSNNAAKAGADSKPPQKSEQGNAEASGTSRGSVSEKSGGEDGGKEG